MAGNAGFEACLACRGACEVPSTAGLYSAVQTTVAATLGAAPEEIVAGAGLTAGSGATYGSGQPMLAACASF